MGAVRKGDHMSVSKIKDGSGWKVYIRYVDWQGKKQVHTKQTFETKRDALNYERDFLQKKSRDIQMNFAKFVEIYLEDIKPRIKLSTFMTKKHIIETKILPYFENKSLAEINSTDVIQWQNVLLCARDENGRAYAATYLRTVQNQLNAIFNHAHRFYGLAVNGVLNLYFFGVQILLFFGKKLNFIFKQCIYQCLSISHQLLPLL